MFAGLGCLLNPVQGIFQVHSISMIYSSFPLEVNDEGTLANLIIPAGTLQTFEGNDLLYLCLRPGKTSSFLHQGTFKSLQVSILDWID